MSDPALERLVAEYGPCLALSIRQPWAWAILHLGKNIENRSWPTKFRGRFFIHAAKGCTRAEYEYGICFGRWASNSDKYRQKRIPALQDMDRGGVVGVADLVACVESYSSAWFAGPYGFVLENVRPVPFVPCKGRQGFFYLY
ncbi:ASCH domain-containing protein [Ruficoccus amylovorans]|uniref:ASCH domain-containing protein n=1 Tax=Ruficoccus amylovorans TaxID=1804625 RepID=A0A842H8W9_9BACT|nr:ASCH domain-containing protein [Ruficoccus amylovorans]MBC2592665.1 ASCH domain-containing protein [Ruficoccus amylovorans]